MLRNLFERVASTSRAPVQQPSARSLDAIASVLRGRKTLDPQTVRDVVAALNAADPAGAKAAGLPQLGIFLTKAHTTILTELLNRALPLSRGSFAGHGDLASCTLLGPRGIGKSTTLEAFAAVAPFLLPNVVPVYVSYLEDDNVRKVSILETAAAKLKNRGIIVSGPATVSSVAAALAQHDLYLLLLVDEFDKMYENALPLTWRIWEPPCVRTLWQLAGLTAHREGRFSTMLCGSSGMLMDLVTTNAKVQKENLTLYPSLPAAFNINSSKFHETRIRYGSPVELPSVGAILGFGEPTSWTAAQLAAVRHLTFAAGTTARAIDRLLFDGRGVTSDSIADLYVNSAMAARRTKSLSKIHDVYRTTMNKLWARNYELMSELAPDNKVNMDRIASTDWTKGFRPLDHTGKLKVALELNCTEQELHTRLVHLYDRDWLAFGDSWDFVYPRSLWSLLKFREEEQSGGRGASDNADILAHGISHNNANLIGSMKQSVAVGGAREVGKQIVRNIVDS